MFLTILYIEKRNINQYCIKVIQLLFEHVIII